MKSFKIVCTFGVACLFFVMFLIQVPSLQAAELVQTSINGQPSNIPQKLIANKRAVVWQGDRPKSGRKKLVSPFNIFLQAKTDAGRDSEGDYYRIAAEDGNSLGWINKSDVVFWQTRYTISPIDSTKNGDFVTYLDPGQTLNEEGEKSTVGDKSTYLEDTVPKGCSKFCFILDRDAEEDARDSDGPFKVILATAESTATGSTQQLQNLENLDLEIVFESSDFINLADTALRERRFFRRNESRCCRSLTPSARVFPLENLYCSFNGAY